MKTKFGCIYIVLALCVFGSITHASTITWTNTAGGNWSLPVNWSPNQVPGSNDTANVTTAGTYAIMLNVSANVNGLIIGDAASGVQTLAGNSFTLVATNATISSGGILNLTNSTLSGSIMVSNGAVVTMNKVTVAGQMTVANGGQLLLVGAGASIGAGDAKYTNEWLWVQSGGVLDAASGAGLTMFSAATNSGVINLTNSTITINNLPGFDYDGGLVNLAGGTINLWAGGGISGYSYGEGLDYFINQGTINLGSASGTVYVSSLISQGTVSTSPGSGTLLIGNFNGLGSLAGSFNAAAGTIIKIGASASPGTSADPGLTLGGAGQYQFVSGLLTLATSVIPNLQYTGGTLMLGVNFQGGSITNLTLNGITLTNPPPVTGTLILTNSTLSGSIMVSNGAVVTMNKVTVAGQMTVANGGQLLLVGAGASIGAGDAKYTNEWLWVQSGGVLDAASGAGLTMFSAATNSGVINLTNSTITINNLPGFDYDGGLVNLAGGTINLWAGGGISGYSYGEGLDYFINQGTINLGSASGTVYVSSLISQGTVSTSPGSGTLLIGNFNGLGSLAGSFNAAAGTIIKIGASASPGTSADPGLTLGGAGQYQFVSGLLTLATSVIPNLQYTGGTLMLGVNFQGGSITNLTLNGITLTNPPPVTGTLILTNSTLSGSIMVSNGAVVTMNKVTVAGQMTVANGGQLLLVGAFSALGNGSSSDTNYWLWVQSGGLLNLASGQGLYLYSVVTNSGVINLTNTTITIFNTGSSFNAGGLVNQASGTINLWAGGGINSNFGVSEYLINQGGINVYSTNNTSTINVVNITNAGTFSAQHGTMQLQGTHVSLQSSETFNVGLNSATDYGSIAYNCSTALNLSQAGTFVVTLNGGYVPAVSNSFTVLLANGSGTFSGSFTNFSSPSGAIWQTNYTATSLILTNVGQIIWAAPSSITYGTALGGGQLNASTALSVAGAFVYNPVAGTVQNSGAGQLLAAMFNPSVTGDAPASLQVPITVLKAPLGVTATNQSKIYGQNITFAGTEFVSSGLVNGDTVTSASIASAGAISNAPVSGSPYAITINNAQGDAGLTNYIITYTNGMFIVNQAPLGITANSSVKTYGQNIIFAGTEFVSSGLQNLETIGTVTLNSAGAISNAPVSGSPYSIVPGAATGGTFTPGNYAITYNNGALTVNRAGLAVTANNAARTYGTANPLFNVSYSGFVNNENASVVSGVPGFSTPATGTSGIGGYTITPSLGTLSAANYSFGPFNNGTLTINTAALSITATNQSKTYGQNITFTGTEFVSSGLVNGDTVTNASIASAGAISNAPVSGSPYAITINSAQGDAGLTNYTIAYHNGLLTVNKALLGITANSTSKIYGQNVTFSGTEFISSPLQNSETIGMVTLTSAGAISNVPVNGSPYSIVPGAATGGTFTPGNYAITYTNGSLTVNPAQLGITANNQIKTYGQNITFAGTEFMSSGLQNLETIGMVKLTSTGAISNAPVIGSPYSIVSSAATGGTFTPGNYMIGYTNGALTVNQAVLTITASSTNKIAGEIVTFEGTEFTAAGLQNSETIGTVTLTSPGAAAAASAGPYNIVPSAPVGGTFAPGNYSDIFVDGTLTVLGPPELTLTTLGNKYVLTFSSVSGQIYQLQSSTNLAVAGWSSLGGTIPGTGGTVSVTNTIANQLSFFKLQIMP